MHGPWSPRSVMVQIMREMSAPAPRHQINSRASEARQDFTIGEGPYHSVIFPRVVVHRVENGWGLTKVAVVLLNALIW